MRKWRLENCRGLAGFKAGIVWLQNLSLHILMALSSEGLTHTMTDKGNVYYLFCRRKAKFSKGKETWHFLGASCVYTRHLLPLQLPPPWDSFCPFCLQPRASHAKGYFWWSGLLWFDWWEEIPEKKELAQGHPVSECRTRADPGLLMPRLILMDGVHTPKLTVQTHLQEPPGVSHL